MNTPKITPLIALMLVIPPLMWAGNAVVGRMVAPHIPPITLNFLRWVLAFVLLIPLAYGVLRPSSALWPSWRRFALLGLLGTGGYNTLQYVALQTSSPLNTTLVASSTPIWMLLIGKLFFGTSISRQSLVGAVLSMAGVFTVIAQGQLHKLLSIQLVPGDAWMVLASLVWAWYSWLLATPTEPKAIRQDWSAFLIGQMFFGLIWSGLFTAAEWQWLAHHSTTPQQALIDWSWGLAAALLYVAVGPSLLAYRCWSAGVQGVGPTIASFFSNLTPVFAALLSTVFLGQAPQGYHLLAFALIVAGITVSSRRS
jgi:drug/metabolite transporter (DMT)-like permease